MIYSIVVLMESRVRLDWAKGGSRYVQTKVAISHYLSQSKLANYKVAVNCLSNAKDTRILTQIVVLLRLEYMP